MSRILIAEDKPHIVVPLIKGLEATGFTTHTTAKDGQAVTLAVQKNFDLIILDAGLPGIDDFGVLQQLRGQGVGTPVTMLTACSSVADHVTGLEGGTDDYMPKPFSFEKLLARIRVRLRPDATGPNQMHLAHRDMVLGLRTHTLTLRGRIVEFSVWEFVLVETFMRHPGQVLSCEQLLSVM